LGVYWVGELNQLPIKLILDQPVHIVLLAEVPNIMSVDLHGIGVLSLLVMVEAVALPLQHYRIFLLIPILPC
jgi:hypothetical protein